MRGADGGAKPMRRSLPTLVLFVASTLISFALAELGARLWLERFADEEAFKKFATIDLHPERVSNRDMGYVFEELIRKDSEARNEAAGDHFTPREVIRLMVNLLFGPDSDALQQPGIVRTLFDPAAGTE